MIYSIRRIDGMEHTDLLHYMNSFEPERFPQLQSKHFTHGLWWIVQIPDGTVVGFAGLVPFTPCDDVGYLKRAYVLPDHRGYGLQVDLIRAREAMARSIGMRQLVTECAADNVASAANLRHEGFVETTPEQPWGEAGAIYFVKRLA